MRTLFIVLSPTSGDGQPLNLAPSYLFEFELPAFAWLGDKEQNQAIPNLTACIVGCLFHALTILRARNGYLVLLSTQGNFSPRSASRRNLFHVKSFSDSPRPTSKSSYICLSGTPASRRTVMRWLKLTFCPDSLGGGLPRCSVPPRISMASCDATALRPSRPSGVFSPRCASLSRTNSPILDHRATPQPTAQPLLPPANTSQ
jgi:hypothetical protein